MTLKKKPFENIERIRENVGNQNFLLFPQCFLPIPNRISVVKLHLSCCLQIFWIWTSLKIWCLVKWSLVKVVQDIFLLFAAIVSTIYRTIPTCNDPVEDGFEKHFVQYQIVIFTIISIFLDVMIYFSIHSNTLCFIYAYYIKKFQTGPDLTLYQTTKM